MFQLEQEIHSCPRALWKERDLNKTQRSEVSGESEVTQAHYIGLRLFIASLQLTCKPTVSQPISVANFFSMESRQSLLEMPSWKVKLNRTDSN